jgi:hypothetical protein
MKFMVFKGIEFVHLKDEFWFLTIQTMSRSWRRSSLFKGWSQELDWDAIEDLECVAEPRWQVEHTTPWTYTTYKTYVKMKHLAKLWP